MASYQWLIDLPHQRWHSESVEKLVPLVWRHDSAKALGIQGLQGRETRLKTELLSAHRPTAAALGRTHYKTGLNTARIAWDPPGSSRNVCVMASEV